MQTPAYIYHALNTLTLGGIDKRPPVRILHNEFGERIDNTEEERAFRNSQLFGTIAAGTVVVPALVGLEAAARKYGLHGGARTGLRAAQAGIALVAAPGIALTTLSPVRSLIVKWDIEGVSDFAKSYGPREELGYLDREGQFVSFDDVGDD